MRSVNIYIANKKGGFKEVGSGRTNKTIAQLEHDTREAIHTKYGVWRKVIASETT